MWFGVAILVIVVAGLAFAINDDSRPCSQYDSDYRVGAMGGLLGTLRPISGHPRYPLAPLEDNASMKLIRMYVLAAIAVVAICGPGLASLWFDGWLGNTLFAIAVIEGLLIIGIPLGTYIWKHHLDPAVDRRPY